MKVAPSTNSGASTGRTRGWGLPHGWAKDKMRDRPRRGRNKSRPAPAQECGPEQSRAGSHAAGPSPGEVACAPEAAQGSNQAELSHLHT